MDQFSREMDMIICFDEFMARQYIPKRGNMLDVGSCYGMWIDFMLEKADKIYAFEPDRRLFYKLAKKYNNEFKVKLFNIGISDVCGSTAFEFHEEGNSKLGNSEIHGKPDEIITITIDSVFENIPLSCIKIDIEGREMWALNGGLKTILKCTPILIIEAHDNRQEIKDFFDKYHYKIVFSHGRSRFPQTDNVLMVAVHESKMNDNNVDIEMKNPFKRYSGKIALGILEGKGENNENITD